MRMTVDTAENIENALANVSKLIDGLQQVDNLAKSIRFLTIDDVAGMTGWSRAIIAEMFNMPDFPSCNYGKSKLVEAHALIDFFSVPRRKK
jgi:predicted DNA-binding transcriptional regulator AlpA